MKRLVFGSVVLVVFSPSLLNAADPSALKQVFQKYTEAFMAGDAEKMLAFYEPADDVKVVISSGGSFTGKAELRKMFQGAFEEADWQNVSLPDLKFHQEGNVAWATCRFQAVLVTKPDREKYRFISQGIYVLRRLQGSWKIVSEHFSPIRGVERIQPLKHAAPSEPKREKGVPESDKKPTS